MILLKHILVPVDFSETSGNAVKYGVALARQFKANLVLLHVEILRDYDVIVEGERVVEETLSIGGPLANEDVVSHAARELMGQLLTPDEEGELGAHYELVPGRTEHASDDILRYAREHQIDLIVMGTHGRGFVQHVLMGSVADRVVREAPCPVLVVRSHEREFVLPEKT